MINMKNETEQSSCHSRDCEAITDNLSRIITSVIPDLIGYLSRIKKEAAEIFGSCFASPKMTEEGRRPKMTMQRHSEAEPKNPRKVQHNDWILHFAFAPFRMTIPAQALALILTFGAIGESIAECNQTNADGKTVNEAGNYCGTCGTNCNWVIESGILKINGSGKMDDYTQKTINGTTDIYDINGNTRPWNDYKENISAVQIEGIKNIGSYAFKGISLENVAINKGVENIGDQAFGWCGLQQIEIPNSVLKIDSGAFAGNHFTSVDLGDSLTDLGGEVFWGSPLKSVIIPDSLKEVGIGAFGRDESNFKTEKLEIICRGNSESCENLQNVLSEYFYYVGYYDDEKVYHADKNSLNLYSNVKVANKLQCTSTNYYWNGKSCNNKKNGIKCADNWKRNEDFCNRIRYTPTEAAQWSKENDNTVVLTFKK